MHHPFVLLVGTRGFPLLLAAVYLVIVRRRTGLMIRLSDCIRRFAVLCTGQRWCLFICNGCDQCGKVEIILYSRTYDVPSYVAS